MSRKNRHQLSFWKKAFIVLCIAAQTLFFFSIPFTAPQKRPAPPASAFVSYLDIDSDLLQPAFEEFAVFFDSEALFLPTQWNYANNVGLPEFEERFPLLNPFPPLTELDRLTFERNTALPPVRLHPAQLLRNKYWNILLTFGQNPQTPKQIIERLAFVRVFDLQSGKNVISEPITEIENFEQATLLWEKAIFLVLIEPQGVIGFPLMEQSSGVASIDDVLKTYLVRTDLLSRLKSGYYKIVFNP